MGSVSTYLRELIAKQVDQRRLVVWFDPENAYREFAAQLRLDDAAVVTYEGSYFALRHQVAPLLEGEEPPRIVVYVPVDEETTSAALIELTAAGVVFKPGQQPWQRNTGLSVIARAALKEALGSDQLKSLDRQIEAGQLATLTEVEAAVERIRRQVDPGVISLVFGTSDPEEIALSFLIDDSRDETIRSKGAERDLSSLLNKAYGRELPVDSTAEIRGALARHVLCTDLRTTLQEPIPLQLATVRAAEDTGTQEACRRLAGRWRHDRERGDTYAANADRVEREIGLASIPLTIAQIGNCETFAGLEPALQTAVEVAWSERPTLDLLAIVEPRLRSFWVQRQAEMQARWSLSAFAGHALLMADKIEKSLNDSSITAAALIKRYTEGEEPWCELDTYQRELEQRSHRFDFTAEHQSLIQLLARARQRYMEIGDRLASQFTHALADESFRLPAVPRQRAVYQQYVVPALQEGKTAYILADALRFEMARELLRGLDTSFHTRLDAALASVPTITEIGMASLLPDVSAGAEIVVAGPRKLGLRASTGVVLRDRTGRLAWLREHVTRSKNGRLAEVAEVSLDDLLSFRPSVKSRIEPADLVVVTSQEIDAISEMDNVGLARTVMDELLTRLARGLRRLGEAGCERIILAADHGYLFGEELDSAMKIDPPGGQTLALHRRVWVGRGGTSSPAYFRTKLSSFQDASADSEDLGDDALEIAAPWGFGAFKMQGGARAYFHGGLSLQELVIPVATLTPVKGTIAAKQGDIIWSMSLGSKRITTRTCSVTISGARNSLFETAVPPVRVEARSGKDVVSTLRFATYGLNDITQEVQLQYTQTDPSTLEPATVMLEVDPDKVRSNTVAILLLEARSGRELARLDTVEIRIGIL